MTLSQSTFRSGHFLIGERRIAGDLSLNGRDTKLYLHDPEFIFDDPRVADFITGELSDRTKVSLIQCNWTKSGRRTIKNECYSYAEIFPHFVTIGYGHLNPTEKSVMGLRLLIDDAPILFYEYDTFSFSLYPKDFIQDLVKSASRFTGREVPVGDSPEIAYFTGRKDIASAEVEFGRISACHNPRAIRNGPRGAYIENQISLDLTFHDPHTFDSAIRAVEAILLFLELVIGRTQNIIGISLRLDDNDTMGSELDLHWILKQERTSKARFEDSNPHPSEVLIMGAKQSAQFASVLTNWLSRTEGWQEARWRFSGGFSKGNSYEVDRLIGAANMFDILPVSAIPPDKSIHADVESACKQARAIFKKLPESWERESVLNAIGRVGSASLRQKVSHRASIIEKKLPEKFPQLDCVIGIAIDCRNHFVHGSKPKIDYAKNYHQIVPFLTDTLEFIFGASDLIDAGWDAREWCRRAGIRNHPFASFSSTYSFQKSRLLSIGRGLS